MATTVNQQPAPSSDARALRLALDVQLEHVRSLSEEDRLAFSIDEQLAQFLMITSQYSEEALQKAVLMTNHEEKDVDADINTNNVMDNSSSSSNNSNNNTDTHRLPIHLACDTNAPIEIIRWLLDKDPNHSSILRKDKWGDLPLHTACSRKDVNVVRLLVEADVTNETILTKDNDGSLPIHMACRYNAPAEAIQVLLDSDASDNLASLFTVDAYDQLPIHVACRCTLPPTSIALLLDYDKDKRTVLMEDNAGRLPLHVAYLRHNHPEVLRLLLRAMLADRITRVGLDFWKQDMRQCLTSLQTHERDFTAADRLEMTQEVFTEYLECACLLELAVWKASMELRKAFNSSDFSIAQEGTFKQECRIKSGAEIIIPGVLSFLAEEPILKLFEKFAS